jgi:hypothetical protein
MCMWQVYVRSYAYMSTCWKSLSSLTNRACYLMTGKSEQSKQCRHINSHIDRGELYQICRHAMSDGITIILDCTICTWCETCMYMYLNGSKWTRSRILRNALWIRQVLLIRMNKGSKGNRSLPMSAWLMCITHASYVCVHTYIYVVFHIFWVQ